MNLTRRDALVALGALGLSGAAWVSSESVEELSISRTDIDDLVALSETLYPREVSIEAEFIETYVVGQHQLDEDHDAGIARALETLRQRSREHTGKRLQELTADQRGEVIRTTGADRAFPDPEGTTAQQVRYYILNNLLYALYTTPVGGELVGNPNPPGYPGGTTAYQEGPDDE